VGLTAALALVDLGRHEEATPLLERLLAAAAPDVTGRGDVLFVLAEAALWAGRPADALTHLAAYREYEASEYPTSFLVDVTAGWAALDAGRPIPPALGRAEAAGMLVGATLERRGIEALAGADHETAAALFGEAAFAYVGYHRRGELRTAWASGDARRRAGAEDVARAALERVEAEAAAGGFVPLLGRVHRSLRLLGVRRATRAPTMDRSSRFTARERDLAQLAGRGLTNPEIARRMGLGRPTVARLLSSAMIKLGVDSRAQLVARLEELV
jgi:DNA-binding CsgD family transcriptional regulator